MSVHQLAIHVMQLWEGPMDETGAATTVAPFIPKRFVKRHDSLLGKLHLKMESRLVLSDAHQASET